jgi:GTP-binding protein
MFFDVARINVKGGDGGKGCMAMRREYCVDMGGPSGGNGGNGGNVYFECDTNLNTLASLRTQVHYKGEDGNNGLGDSRHGRKGKDIIVKVPPGTIVRNEDGILAGELNNHGDRMLVAKGGRGGRGNEYFKTARYTAPSFAEKGEKGIDRWLFLELKLLADLGLVGVPNAGKSTFLAAVTNAKPKIADYPFTTVVPNLGVCDLFMEQQKNGEFSGSSIVLADIPGLLEGAHQGVGLGLAFLRHIQRCR